MTMTVSHADPKRRAAKAATGIAAIGAASLWAPLVGLPLAAGAVAYSVVRLSQIHLLPARGRIPARPRRRVAMIVGGALFIIAGACCDILYSLDVANGLEARLGDRIEAAAAAGRLTLGEAFHTCGWAACASATITRLPAGRLFGVATLTGFTLRGEKAFGWPAGNARRAAR